MKPNASAVISLFFVPLLTVVCTAACDVRAQEDEFDVQSVHDLLNEFIAQEDESDLQSLSDLITGLMWVRAQAKAAQEEGASSKSFEENRTSSLRPSDGYLINWSVIGPFSAREENSIGFAAIDIGEVTAVDSVQHAGREYFWTYAIAKNGAAKIDLSSEFGADAVGIAYAAAEVYVNRDMNATIRVETDDKVACWINDQAVKLVPKKKDDGRAFGSQIRLRFGHNKVVIGLRHGRGKWSFRARVLDEAGEPIDPKRLRLLDDGLGIGRVQSHQIPATIKPEFPPELHRP